MYLLIKRNWDKTKHIILFSLTATLLLLLTVVYKSDEKITKKSGLIQNSTKVADLKTFKEFLLNIFKKAQFSFNFKTIIRLDLCII